MPTAPGRARPNKAARPLSPSPAPASTPPVETGARREPSPPISSGNVLLVVADPDGAAIDELARGLSGYGVDIVACTNGPEALLQIGILRPDAILVSAGLHPLSCTDLVRAVRGRFAIPVLVGVGEGAEADEGVQALAAGANACVARPYRHRQLLPILRAVPVPLPSAASLLEHGVLRLNSAAFDVHLRGERIQLPLREFQLLELLMTHVEKVVSRDQIRQALWGSHAESSNTITVHVRRLRARLGDDPRKPRILQTVRGRGYRLIPPSA